MAYKKYIQRNGKLYGPYLYESKRVDGKVVSEYHGSEEPKKSKGVRVYNYKKILFLFLGVFILAVLIYFLITIPNYNKISGNAVFGIDTSYIKGEPLDGILKLSLKEGEFIPASSKVIFENLDKSYEFVLSDIISESPSDGNYYVEEISIQGNGSGYGDEGKKEIYPEVKFVLQVYNEAGEIVENPTEATPDEITTLEETFSEEVNSVEEETPDTSVPITGNSVKTSGGFLTSLFGMTGMVSMELQEEIEGTVSKDKPFVYEIKEGEKIELKPKSIIVNGEEISDSTISLDIKDNLLTVTTEYSETEKGYGQEYLGDKDKDISLDLSDLNLTLEEGDLKVKILYEGEEILSLNTILKEGEEVLDEVTEEEVKEQPEEIIEEEPKEEEIVEIPSEVNESDEVILENETVEEIINSSLWEMGNFLTPEERTVLIDNFGEIQLTTVKSELFKGRIIIGYDFAGYSVEYSYDSSLNKDILDIEMEKDRIKFLKDIANSLLREEESSKPLEGFNETYTP
ncbi:MAG: hypothetical protein ACP5NZ_02785 [Nanobdellota archaeon]